MIAIRKDIQMPLAKESEHNRPEAWAFVSKTVFPEGGRLMRSCFELKVLKPSFLVNESYFSVIGKMPTPGLPEVDDARARLSAL